MSTWRFWPLLAAASSLFALLCCQPSRTADTRGSLAIAPDPRRPLVDPRSTSDERKPIGGARAPTRSSGCGKALVPRGNRSLEVDSAPRQLIVEVPKDYDGTRDYPLVFGFHGKNRTHEQCRDGDCRGLQRLFGDRAIIVYMKSKLAGWQDEGVGFGNNLPFFDAALETMKREYCVDESRVIVAGTSSGGFFANELACVRGDQIMAVIPVGGALGEREGCKRPIPALVIHGIDDIHVPFVRGESARDFYRTRNGCSDRTEPTIVEAHQAVRAERDAGQETYRCVDYQGCAPGLLVRWCEHGEGGYDNSTHAWPTFGGQMILDFLTQLH